MGGAVERVTIDNTQVVVLRGAGRETIPGPEMEAFAERFGFRFVAHQIGDAHRSARVERPFSCIENNFPAGRTFAGWQDPNQRARQWCGRVNSTHKKHIRARRRGRPARTVRRRATAPETAAGVDSGSVSPAATNGGRGRLLPVSGIGRRVEARETRDKIEIELDARHLVAHVRAPTPQQRRITPAAHRPPHGEGDQRSDPHPEERAILHAAPQIEPLVAPARVCAGDAG
jgi:hypothetical protein